MSSERLALAGRGLGKAYTIVHNATDHVTMAQVAVERFRHPLRRVQREEFWALRGVDLDLHEGETLGLLGRNGAGKSTLLKLLGRVTQPTEGELRLWGRVGCLLNVGTGFHPELTGRENVYLNGSVLGMKTREIAAQFDAIVAFAGVEKFLDTPLKRYSSGMYVRLAFAVAAHLESEILLVDEVLSVGDAAFQRKCIEKMRQLAASGRSVVLVSHHLRNVEELCGRSIVLEDGAIAYDGNTAGAIAHHLRAAESGAGASDPESRDGSGELRVTEVAIPTQNVAVEEPKRIRFRVEAFREGLTRCNAEVILRDSNGVAVAHCNSGNTGDVIDVVDGPVDVACVLVSPWLHPGDYRVDVWLWDEQPVDRFEWAARLTVRPGYPYAAGSRDAVAQRDLVPPDCRFELRPVFGAASGASGASGVTPAPR